MCCIVLSLIACEGYSSPYWYDRGLLHFVLMDVVRVIF